MSDAHSNQEDQEQQELQEQQTKYAHFVVKPDLVDPLWNHEDPSTLCQNLLLDHLDFIKQDTGRDINAYDENEKRYEKNQELKILGDFIIDALVCFKHNLKVDNPEVVAKLIQVFWETLDFKDMKSTLENGSAVNQRFDFLKREL
mmetsp:Transcript_23064/g.35701  ORF Transcript_23064/g.35701 Transcript_23064/m.35701 type:complete len:145 (+) Transcript_23064:7-441(+)